MASPTNAVYWVGSNGVAYVKGSNGQVTGYTNLSNVGNQGFSGITGGQGRDVEATRIADPNAPTTNTNTASSSGSSSSSYTAPDAAISGQATGALGTALNALNASNAEVAAEEGQQENELNSNQASQQNTYNNTLTTNAQNLTDAETGARTQGNTDLTSLDRLLGSLGAGGSSVETEEIPTLVDRSVAGNISGASTTAAKNVQAANVAWNTFLNQLNSQRQQLQDQASQQTAQNTGTYNKVAQALNMIISAAKGGSISPSDLSYELESAVGSIPAVVNWTPSFSGTTPVYATPALSDFTLSPSQVATASGTTLPSSGGSVIPFLSSLTQNQQNNQNPVPAAA